MSITYSDLFAKLGKIIKTTNAMMVYAGTTLMGSGSGADEILDQYDDRRDLVTGMQEGFTGFGNAVGGWVTNLKGYADRTLADLQKELNSPSNSPATILPLLALDMVANSQTVDANTISAPSSSAGGGNVGNGSLSLSKLSDANVDDQRAISEAVDLVCTADQATGATVGGEQFSVTGWPSYAASDYRTRGNGNGPTLAVANESGANKLTNGNFETFTVTNTPDSWTISAGAVTTNILKEATNLHAATSTGALQLLSNGAATTVTLSQAIATKVSASTLYAVGCFVRKNGTVAAGSNLQISIKGTGYSTVNLFNADPSTLTTSYVLKSAFFAVGAVIPSDLKLEITWTSVNSTASGAKVLIDDAALVQPVTFGYTKYALFRGSTDFAKGDTFTVTTANDGAGTIMTWMSRFYGVQLPSDAVGGETIADSLGE